MFREILVPLDGSPRSEHAIPFALSVARKSGATLHLALVHVPASYSDDSVAHSEDLGMDAKERELKYLNALKARLAKSFDGVIKLHHPEGIVPETLAGEVIERHIDLVVMNAHGWGYISRALVGSVSDYLMRHLTVPLLLMHSQGANVELERPVSFRRILIPLDGSELGEAMLGPAQALGQVWDSDFQLMRVVSPGHSLAGLGEQGRAVEHMNLDRIRTHASAYLESVAGRLSKASRTPDFHVCVSLSAAAAILQEATTTGCDLIAVSTHGRGGLSRLLLGSVADKVVRGAHTPVLVYRPQQAD